MFAKVSRLIEEIAQTILALTEADSRRIVNVGLVVIGEEIREEVSGQVSYIPQGAVMKESVQVIASIRKEDEGLRFIAEICWSDGEMLKELVRPKLLSKTPDASERELDELCVGAAQEGKLFLISELPRILERRRGEESV